MAIVATALIKKIADELLKKYDGKLPDDLLPDKESLIDGLITMVSDGLLPLGEKTTAAAFKPAMLNTIENLGKSIQEKSNGLLRRSDGRFGRSLLNHLKQIAGCESELHDADLTKLKKPKEAFSEREIRYFVDGDLPPIQGGIAEHDLISRAWVAWQKVADIGVIKALSKDGANVIIKQGAVDGRNGGRLARAHIGPPKGRQLQLTFDVAETWDEEKFLATAIHEMGHILGLRHAAQSGLIMSTHRTPGIVKLQQGDIVAIRKIWGPPPPPPPTPPAGGIEGIGEF